MSLADLMKHSVRVFNPTSSLAQSAVMLLVNIRCRMSEAKMKMCYHINAIQNVFMPSVS